MYRIHSCLDLLLGKDPKALYCLPYINNNVLIQNKKKSQIVEFIPTYFYKNQNI